MLCTLPLACWVIRSIPEKDLEIEQAQPDVILPLEDEKTEEGISSEQEAGKVSEKDLDMV